MGLWHFAYQFERGEALDNITRDVKRALEEEGDEESLLVLSRAVDTARKKVSSNFLCTINLLISDTEGSL